MQPGEISEPIKRQNTILFLKLIESRISKVRNVDTEELKNNLISQKKMNYLIYILVVTFQT